MSGNNAVKYFEDDYEIVDLPDGTQALREHLTKSQLRIKALKERNRNKQLNDHLLAYANEIRKKCSDIASEKSSKKDQSAIRHQIKDNRNGEKLDLKSYLSSVREAQHSLADEASAIETQHSKVNEASAIERQKKALEEKLGRISNSPRTEKRRTFKWPKLKSIRL